jgi:hypothetical protein
MLQMQKAGTHPASMPLVQELKAKEEEGNGGNME